LCFSGIVYVAKIDDKELTFEASGKLWQDALVMEDDQTGSLWSQISGECIMGKMLGKKLELYPAQYSTFGGQKDRPAIQFLIKPEKGPGQSHYQKYFEDRSRMGIAGNVYNDSLLGGKDLVYGIRQGNAQVAVPKSLFDKQPAYIVELGRFSLLLLAGNDGDMACYLLPYSDLNVWTLVIETDKISIWGSSGDKPWVVFENGVQTEGAALGKFPVITVYWFAWKSFFPASKIFQPEE
jgi:hypothetical protein